jgi:hypothetical protein
LPVDPEAEFVAHEFLERRIPRASISGMRAVFVEEPGAFFAVDILQSAMGTTLTQNGEKGWRCGGRGGCGPTTAAAVPTITFSASSTNTVSALGSLAPSMMQVPPMNPGPWRAGEVDSPKDQRNRRPRISTMGAAPVVTQMLVLINELFVRCKNI